MKKFIFTTALAIAACAMLSTAAQAQSVSYQQANMMFQKLSRSPAASVPVHTATTSNGSRFSVIGKADTTPPPPVVIQPITPTVTPSLGVKVWFELVNGTVPTGQFVNPEKHKFQRQERFRVVVQTATPITMAISQYYPERSGAGKPVYPDAKYPSTYGVIPPNVRYPLPVLFAMDDTLTDEHMMLAISSATSSTSPVAWNQQQLTALGATPTTTPANQFGTTRTAGGFINQPVSKPAVAAGTSRFLAAASEKIAATATADLKKKNRFTIVSPGPAPTPGGTPPVIPPSPNPEDVQSILLHGNGSGVATFRLHKD